VPVKLLVYVGPRFLAARKKCEQGLMRQSLENSHMILISFNLRTSPHNVRLFFTGRQIFLFRLVDFIKALLRHDAHLSKLRTCKYLTSSEEATGCTAGFNKLVII